MGSSGGEEDGGGGGGNREDVTDDDTRRGRSGVIDGEEKGQIRGGDKRNRQRWNVKDRGMEKGRDK